MDGNVDRRSDTENQTAAPRPSPGGEIKVASLALPATRLLSSLNAKQIPAAVNNTQRTTHRSKPDSADVAGSVKDQRHSGRNSPSAPESHVLRSLVYFRNNLEVDNNQLTQCWSCFV